MCPKLVEGFITQTCLALFLFKQAHFLRVLDIRGHPSTRFVPKRVMATNPGTWKLTAPRANTMHGTYSSMIRVMVQAKEDFFPFAF
jgi:hypothetical protein